MVIILCIVLIGYGTAVQAIMFPHVTDPILIAKGIFYRPLFQTFGELFLNDITGRFENDLFIEDTKPTYKSDLYPMYTR